LVNGFLEPSRGALVNSFLEPSRRLLLSRPQAEKAALANNTRRKDRFIVIRTPGPQTPHGDPLPA
jgi:hypothetical protein